LLAAYSADFRNGHVRFGATRFGPPTLGASMHIVRASFMMFDYLFAGWPFRRLYLELPEYNRDQLESSIGSLFETEAVLREYLYLDGRYWDQIILGLSRPAWETVRCRYSKFAPPLRIGR
jgi:hypothetical protein